MPLRYGTGQEYDRFADEYRLLYIDTLKPIIERIDCSRDYLSSSPSNGKFVEKENWISRNPQDRSYGDSMYQIIVHTTNYVNHIEHINILFSSLL